MVDLEKEPDTIISPTDALTEEMKLEGTSNDLDHNQFIGGDEVNLLGDGVPGYETTGVDGTDDEIAEQQEASTVPMSPRPKLTP
ncbi:hypothetical protein TUM19329_06590 [Legionella antarctica]|uniref:Uncharacterized protein n=1 Tax=Legionella antarctica TaxID=2708020 RepID=A0A6F8T1N2_9GAMM|nr:hypothetical protein [Legionella antarctica]BCA94298.1 hypothetical protein TUM19329_06590 [Legionella antarctica]